MAFNNVNQKIKKSRDHEKGGNTSNFATGFMTFDSYKRENKITKSYKLTPHLRETLANYSLKKELKSNSQAIELIINESYNSIFNDQDSDSFKKEIFSIDLNKVVVGYKKKYTFTLLPSISDKLQKINDELEIPYLSHTLAILIYLFSQKE